MTAMSRLGCVVRGETSHYDYVCGESARGLMDLTVREGLAIGYGILTVDTLAQAEERADPARGDKGGEALTRGAFDDCAEAPLRSALRR